MFKRIASVITCIVTAAWVSNSPAWNSAAAFITAILAYTASEIENHRIEKKKNEERSDITSKIRDIKRRPVKLAVVDDEQELKHRQMLAEADLNMKRLARNMQLSIARLFLPLDYEEKHGIKRPSRQSQDHEA